MTRTQEQIIAQCEERFAQLKSEHEERKRRDIAEGRGEGMPTCKGCRYLSQHHESWFATCSHPLIAGFKEEVFCSTEDGFFRMNCGLCGIERALWEPRVPLMRRLVEWFLQPWREAKGEQHG